MTPMVVCSNEKELNVVDNNVPNVELKPEADEEQEVDHLEAEAVQQSALPPHLIRDSVRGAATRQII